MMNANGDANDFEDLTDFSIEELREVLAENPANGDALIEIGKRHYKSGRFDLAEEYYRQALNVNADDPWAHIYLGNLHYRCRQHREAIVRFSRACELLPDVSCPYWCLGDVYAAMGKAELAESSYKMAVQVNPDDQQAKRLLNQWYESRYTSD